MKEFTFVITIEEIYESSRHDLNPLLMTTLLILILSGRSDWLSVSAHLLMETISKCKIQITRRCDFLSSVHHGPTGRMSLGKHLKNWPLWYNFRYKLDCLSQTCSG